jgi:hypothetical protein
MADGGPYICGIVFPASIFSRDSVGERESSQEKKYYPWRVCPGKKKPKNVRESFEIKNKYNNDIRYTRPCCDRPGILYWKKPYR